MTDAPAPVVIDNGDGWIKAGFAGEDAPRAVFATVVGYPFHNPFDKSKKYVYVGDAAFAKRATHRLEYPIFNGIVSDWHAMERVWHHTFHHELRTAPEEHAVLLTEPPLNPKDHREKMTQIMFEKFGTPKVFACTGAALALQASGRTTGLVIDVGEAVVDFVPIHEGLALPHAVDRWDVGGGRLTDLMGRLLQERGYDLNNAADRKIVRAIKEKLGYVAQDFDSEVDAASGDEQKYELPDGQVITVGAGDRIRCGEGLFRPRLIQLLSPGIQQLAFETIQKCDAVMRKELYSNVVLSGGSTMFPGFAERMAKEVKAQAPESMKSRIKVIAAPERKFLAWTGGSILASLSTFEPKWITKAEYDEAGPAVVHRKCPNY